MRLIQNRSAFVRRAAARGNLTEAAAEDIADALDADMLAPASKLDLSEVRSELKLDIANLRTELKGDIAALRTELKGEIAALRTELKGEIAALRTEMERNFNRALVIQVALFGALFAALRLT